MDNVVINRQMNKENVVHIHRGISSIKKDEIMLFGGKWTELETDQLQPALMLSPT